MENTLSDLDDLLIQLGYLPYRGSTTSRTSTARSGTEYGVKSFARRPVTRPARASELTSLELCAGGGGQAIGLESAGFRHLGLVELDRHAVATLRANSAKHRLGWNVIEADINRWDASAFKGCIDLLAGGLPCPPFSRAGEQLGEDDERNLWPAALKIV